MKKSLHGYQNREGFFGGQGGIRTHEPLARLPDFECVALRPLFRFFVSEAVSFVVPKSRTVTGFFERHTPENGSVSGLLQNGFESRKNAILGRTEGRQDRTKTERQYTDSTPIILYF